MSQSSIVDYYDRYAEGWNEHDPEAVMAAFADGGTFEDAASDETLRGEEIGEWVEESVNAFPDLHFELQRRISNEEGVLFAEWTMRGTHEGPLNGLPPTHRTIEVGAVEVVELSENGITSLTGYFDMSEINEQLGLTFPAIIGQLPKLAWEKIRGI